MILIEKVIRKDDEARFYEAHVLAEISNKMRLWFLIIKNKAGYPFCVPVKTKVGDTWEPSFELSDDVKMKKLCNDVLKEVLKEETF